MMMMMMVMGKGGRWGSRARKTLKPRERESSQPQSKPALCISPFLFFSLFGLNLGVAGNSRLVVEYCHLLCFALVKPPIPPASFTSVSHHPTLLPFSSLFFYHPPSSRLFSTLPPLPVTARPNRIQQIFYIIF